MKSNFEFLKKYWPEIATIGEAAESYLYKDSNACIYKIGMIAEQIVRGIFDYEKIELPEDSRQSNLIRVLKYRELIPDNIDNILYSIRTARNDAVHNGAESIDKAKVLLKMAYTLSTWYMEVYGDWSFKAPEYVEPEDISTQENYAELIEAQEAKIKEVLEEINRIKTDASDKSTAERKQQAESVSNTLKVSDDVKGYIDREKVKVDIEVLPFLNYALHKNKANIVRNLVIQNDSDEDLENLVLKISATPEICNPFEKIIELIPAHNSYEVKDINLIINVDYLGNLTEKEESYLNFSLLSDGVELCSDSHCVNALPFDEWHGSLFYPEILASFVTPNAPIISALIKRASEFLKNWTGDPSLDAYQSNDAERVMKQAAAVYAALQEQNITYAVPPASFERVGQRVRLCDMVISQKLGTCLDLTLLYAACIEAIGLNTILVLLEGHIFAGVWLENYTFPDSVLDDAAQVTKRLASGVDELIVVECTAFVSSKNMSFDEACNYADSELMGGDNVECIIDIHRARMSGVTPLPSRFKTENGYTFDDDTAEYVTSAPTREINSLDIDSSVQGTARTKKEMWERKLLDLGLRNKLINMSLRPVVPILTDSIDKIEDILSDGNDLYIYPRPQDWHILAKDLDFESMHDLGVNAGVIHSELENKRLRSSLGEGELLSKLKQLYRSSKLSIEENGANTLYIALGLLKWYENERSQKPRFAPLLLMPIEIIRKGGNQGYVIRMRDEDTQMNITILEKLNQDFQIKISGLETLLSDEHGVDTRKVFTIIRKGIMNQSRWDVLESAYVGIFSFSQFVMWNDIKNRADDLARNKIVRSLMEGKLVWEPEPMDLQGYVPSDNLYLPISVDGSQMYAVDSAAKGQSFILHGPPGTGKSQTITVMIANALAQGKSVLFVAEKMAALEVVQKRLEDIGLGPFCLELHSNKAKKKDVLEQLRIASEVSKGSSKEEYERKLAYIIELKKDLDKYSTELHKVRYSGLSFYEMINQYENYAKAKDIDFKSLLDVTKIDAVQLEKMERTIERLIAAARAIGHPQNHPLSVIGMKTYSQSVKEEMDHIIQEYVDSISDFRKAFRDLTVENKLNEPKSHNDIDALVGKCSQFEIWYQYPSEWMEQDNNLAFIDMEKMAGKFISAHNLHEQLLRSWNEEALKMPVNEVLLDYNSTISKWILPKILGLNRIAKTLTLYSKDAVNKNSIGENLLKIKNYQEDKEEAEKLLAIYRGLLGNLYKGDDTSGIEVAEKAQAAKNQFDDLTKENIDKEFIKLIHSNSHNQSLISEVVDSYVQMRRTWIKLEKLLELKVTDDTDDWLEHQINLCSTIQANKENLKEWITWLNVADEAIANGEQCVVDAYYEGMEHDDVLDAYHKAIYRHLAVGAINESNTLNSFSGALFDEQIAQFKKIDKEITELAKKAIYYTLASNVPNFGREATKSSEVGILQRAIKSNGRGISIRSLMDQIPSLLPRLCPCMLMSPISAAQYLDPNREPFDVVIFDEASQLPTSKAVGALARGEEAIIVGDPKQMPPTSFFASNSFDEDNADTEDLESILDDCLALNMPETHLLWHYRSRHESLIAFSNGQFYENKLYTFPSVNDRESKVTLVEAGGIFERGKNRCNRKEAELIVEEVKRRAKDSVLSKYSVGIVTFNISQQNLIDDMIGDACVEDPELEVWVYNETEPLFVKNLENVQGDERDVILFSIAYGPDEEGKVSMNFGPLNREGGWRRLNVAVSRARYEMKVFSSLSADQISLSRTKAEGVAALKSFLEYASGRTSMLDEFSVRGKKANSSGIAGTIKEYLKEMGYDSDILVGRSEFKIDVGVIDPNDADNYLLGIVLDGECYKTSKTTRDREVAQISVLNGLGWNIHRVWTMDWYDNQQKELKKITNLLEELENQKNEDDAGGSLSEKDLIVPVPVVDEKISSNAVQPEIEPVVFSAPEYVATQLRSRMINSDDLFQRYLMDVESALLKVIDSEGPICEGLLFRRVVQSFGIARVGSRIQTRLVSIINFTKPNTTKQESGVVYWPKSIDPNNYRGFRSTGADDNKRDAKDVPVVEAFNAICFVLHNDVSVEEEDLIKEAARIMGYTRVGAGVLALFNEGLNFGKQKGIFINSESRWTFTEQGTEYGKEQEEYIHRSK